MRPGHLASLVRHLAAAACKAAEEAQPQPNSPRAAIFFIDSPISRRAPRSELTAAGNGGAHRRTHTGHEAHARLVRTRAQPHKCRGRFVFVVMNSLSFFIAEQSPLLLQGNRIFIFLFADKKAGVRLPLQFITRSG